MSSTPDTFHRIAPVSDIPPGKMRCFDIEGTPILVCHTREGFFAVTNICTHAYAHLDEGRLRGFRLICPLHGAAFDVRSGDVLGAPATQALRTYPLRVTDEHIEVALV